MTDAPVEVGFGAGAGTLVLPLPHADEGDRCDDQNEHHTAGSDSDDGGGWQRSSGVTPVLRGCRIGNGDMVIGENGITQAQGHTGGRLLLAASF